MTLRKQNKALGSAAVHQNDQRKRQAIKMSICVMLAFYLLYIPFIVVVFLMDTQKSCLLQEALWLFGSLTICLSSTTSPIICFTFVENYRRGLREIFNWCRSERFRRRKTENRHQEEIILQRIRVIPQA